jgi:hypothetical protein
LLITGMDASGMKLYPLDGGAPRPITGLQPGEVFEWTSDPRFGYVYERKTAPVKIYRLNLQNGQRQLFKEIDPADETGLYDMSHLLVSADGRAYVYGYTRLLSELYLVNGVK